MATIIPAGYAQVTLNYSSATFESGAGATVLGFGQPLGPDPTGYAAFAEDVVDIWNTRIAPSTDASITLDSVSVMGPTAGAVEPAGLPGTGAWDSPPSNVAVLMRKNTGTRGPRGRGRTYWPGMVSVTSVNESGVIASGWRGDIQTAVEGFFGDLALAYPDVDHVVLQGEAMPRKDGSPGSPPLSPPPVVTSVSIDARVATQRRRLRR